MRIRLVALLAIVLGGAAHAADTDSARAQEILAPFKRELQQALREGLANGPVEAISACRLKAPEIAERLSRDGVRLGRASHRLRNPANTPPPWVRPILDDYLAQTTNRAARTVALPGGRVGYVEPIPTQPLCLACHGDVLAPDVAVRIEALYPEDRAIGFRTGDLRGVFWIEIPKPE